MKGKLISIEKGEDIPNDIIPPPPGLTPLHVAGFEGNVPWRAFSSSQDGCMSTFETCTATRPSTIRGGSGQLRLYRGLHDRVRSRCVDPEQCERTRPQGLSLS